MLADADLLSDALPDIDGETEGLVLGEALGLTDLLGEIDGLTLAD